MTVLSLPSFGRAARRSLAFVLAVVLPAIALAISSRLGLLHTVPFTLDFISVAALALLGGFAPAVLCSFVSLAANAHLLASHHAYWRLTDNDLAQLEALLLASIFISYLNDRARNGAVRLEEALFELHERTDALLEALQRSRCASWTFDRDASSLRWYRGSFEIFGVPFARVEKHLSPIDLIVAEDRERTRQVIERAIEDGSQLRLDFRVTWPDGEVHWLETRGARVPGGGNVWRGLTFDITERKASEGVLIRTEKLAAMGRLASTVAHEINNPLESVTSLLYLVAADQTLSEESRYYLATADTELARLANITRLTLSFVRTSVPIQTIEIAAILDDVLALFRLRCEMQEIAIERQYHMAVMVTIAPPELRQIVTNLVSNACDALAGVTTATAERPRRLRLSALREGPLAVLTIEDNGPGIAKANIERIFDPYFSTKRDLGTGIGLWVTRELVEKHAGRITAQSGELAGGYRTCFRAEFPLVAGGSTLAQAIGEAQSVPSAVS